MLQYCNTLKQLRMQGHRSPDDHHDVSCPLITRLVQIPRKIPDINLSTAEDLLSLVSDGVDQNAVTVSGRSFRVLENIRGHRNEIQDQIKTAKKDCSCGKDIMKVKKNDISASAGTSKAKESSGPSTSKGTDNEGAVSNCFVKLERIDDSLIKKKVGRKPGPKIGCSGGPILFVDLETGDDVSESPANPTATECRRKVITDKRKAQEQKRREAAKLLYKELSESLLLTEDRPSLAPSKDNYFEVITVSDDEDEDVSLFVPESPKSIENEAELGVSEFEIGFAEDKNTGMDNPDFAVKQLDLEPGSCDLNNASLEGNSVVGVNQIKDDESCTRAALEELFFQNVMARLSPGCQDLRMLKNSIAVELFGQTPQTRCFAITGKVFYRQEDWNASKLRKISEIFSARGYDCGEHLYNAFQTFNDPF